LTAREMSIASDFVHYGKKHPGWTKDKYRVLLKKLGWSDDDIRRIFWNFEW